MGEDGHVASLFPNAPEDIVQSRAVYLPVRAPKPPPERITLTYSVLAAAFHVLVVVSGPGKEPALRDSLSTRHSTPLGRLITLRQHTVLLTDFRFEAKT
jgi:6-phosphogluconolactonase